jgi:predicted amidohydrolase
MPDTLTIALCQWLAVPGDHDTNLKVAEELIGAAARQGADVVVLPELWACGYDAGSLPADAAAAAEPIPGPRTEALAGFARTLGIWLFAGSLPERHGPSLYNTAVAFDRDGRLVASHRKAHLYPTTGEERVFTPGDTLTTVETEELGVVGLTICFDGDFPEVPVALARRGARLVIQPSAYELEAADWWDHIYPGAAVANGQWWVLVNQCGSTPSGTLLGASRIISPSGHVVAEASRTALGRQASEPEVLVQTIPFAAELTLADPSVDLLLRTRRPALYHLS